MAAFASTPALTVRVSPASLCCRETSRAQHLVSVSFSFVSSASRLPRSSLRLVPFARPRRRSSSASIRREEGPPRQKTRMPNSEEDGDNIDEDALEALFAQLEEDLKNDNLLSDDFDDDDDITEEDMAMLEQELEEAFGDVEEDEISGISPGSESLDSEEDDDEERQPKLKNWQIRRLARALKIGRRKTSIKNLAAELGLERAFVLELLRDPPPNILLLSASLPDETIQTFDSSSRSPYDIRQTLEPESEPMESPLTTSVDVKSKPEKDLPVHVMQKRWLMQKRLKKVHIETLERVYSRTKRPTNAMISSIVHVTNLPWKRVSKWFEDKRLEDGVPIQRVPYRRSSSESISTN
ncbi:protein OVEREXPRESSOR OF CATIONIC PEROXIDASE 3-like [Zingiber officinale]|uniref:protein OVEREXPRESSOR OF CATIONIC PEROXIDASE 3-like n=1 Tax=Zingiber officinale TaxID=94328 RepID=UPI001C4C5AD5|nr:protein OVEREXPRESSOR OF CATIONIC PEROXIDASE 3-like [Zingiber officinale]XP_042454471.1 protein OVEREXPRESSOR OF CATIONIC PEROXIDASE 3-like [Zingiber officinale]